MELLAGRSKRRSSLMTSFIYHRPRLGFYSLETGFVLLPHSAVSGCVYHFFHILLAVSTDNEASGRPWYGYHVRSLLVEQPGGVLVSGRRTRVPVLWNGGGLMPCRTAPTATALVAASSEVSGPCVWLPSGVMVLVVGPVMGLGNVRSSFKRQITLQGVWLVHRSEGPYRDVV